MPDELEVKVGQDGAEEAAVEHHEVAVELDDTDPLYKKPDWKTDPAANGDDANDQDYGPKVQKRIGKLRASLTEAAKQRDRASRERDEAINLSRAQLQKIAQYEQMLANGTASYVERQAETEESNSKLAEKDLRQALAMGDADAIAKANRELAQTAARAAQFRRDAELRRASIPQQQVQQQYQQPVQQQQAPQLDPKLRSWAEQNPWMNTDQEMTDAAYEIHDELAASGVRVGSETYFKTIDQKMREKFPQEFKVEQTRRASSPVTSTTRVSSTQQARPTNNQTVTLSSTQIATAKRLGLTPQQYGRELLKLRQEGVKV